MSWAALGDVNALGLLLHRHPLCLRPAWLALLDALPETLPPRSCSHLLPRVRGGNKLIGLLIYQSFSERHASEVAWLLACVAML